MRVKILVSIIDEFGMMAQWLKGMNFQNVSKSENKIEAMVRILEIEDCGSIGGFDRNNKVIKYSEYKLLNRAIALISKHGDGEEVDKQSRTRVEYVINVFEKLHSLNKKGK